MPPLECLALLYARMLIENLGTEILQWATKSLQLPFLPARQSLLRIA
jgi:hypothetical protein